MYIVHGERKKYVGFEMKSMYRPLYTVNCAYDEDKGMNMTAT